MRSLGRQRGSERLARSDLLCLSAPQPPNEAGLCRDASIKAPVSRELPGLPGKPTALSCTCGKIPRRYAASEIGAGIWGVRARLGMSWRISGRGLPQWETLSADLAAVSPRVGLPGQQDTIAASTRPYLRVYRRGLSRQVRLKPCRKIRRSPLGHLGQSPMPTVSAPRNTKMQRLMEQIIQSRRNADRDRYLYYCRFCLQGFRPPRRSSYERVVQINSAGRFDVKCHGPELPFSQRLC